MVAHGGENPTRKANARRHVVHANVMCNLNRHDTSNENIKIL